MTPTDNAPAHHLLPQHTLECSDNFPCPAALRRRVDFWIEVFKTWGKDKAIFHDADKPERVYAVLLTGSGCARDPDKKVARQFEKIRTDLHALATKLEQRQRITTDHARHLLGLFADNDPRALRRARKTLRCQSGVRDGFVQGLQRFQHYRVMVDAVLEQHQLPPEIRYLPFLESAYDPRAHSRVGASGMWQIMPATARNLGLRLDASIDERREPVAATRAAARYLVNATRTLHATAAAIQPSLPPEQVNPFVITSYNYGIAGMRRAMQQVGPDFMQVLEQYKSRNFRIAVKNFYASFLAVSHLAENATRNFPLAMTAPPSVLSTPTLVLKYDTSAARIERVFDVPAAQLQRLNPAVSDLVWEHGRLIPAGYQLKLPHNQNWRVPFAQLAALPPERVMSSGSYQVRKGDTACGIASALQVDCDALIQANRLAASATLQVGQELAIPGARVRVVAEVAVAAAIKAAARSVSPEAVSPPAATEATAQPTPAAPRQRAAAAFRYRVRQGHRACQAAARLRVDCRTPLTNHLSQKTPQHGGQKHPQKPPQKHSSVPLLVAKQRAAQLVVNRSSPPPAAAAPKPPVAPLVKRLAMPPDLGVRATTASGQARYTIEVQVNETLGHYADWLGLRSSARLRQMNNLRRARTLQVGTRLQIPLQDAQQQAAFVQKRFAYHRVLSESLQQQYDLSDIRLYRVKPGDSLWEVSTQMGLPLWLLYRLNPNVGGRALKPGQLLKLPQLKAKTA